MSRYPASWAMMLRNSHKNSFRVLSSCLYALGWAFWYTSLSFCFTIWE